MGSHHTLISKGTRIVGDVHFSGELHIQGTVVGNLIAEANAELEVAPSGKVEGQIHAPKVIVRGLVQGDIHCFKHVELGASAQVQGNVFYNLIEMVKGSQVNGSLIYVSEEDQKRKPQANNAPAA